LQRTQLRQPPPECPTPQHGYGASFALVSTHEENANYGILRLSDQTLFPTDIPASAKLSLSSLNLDPSGRFLAYVLPENAHEIRVVNIGDRAELGRVHLGASTIAGPHVYPDIDRVVALARSPLDLFQDCVLGTIKSDSVIRVMDVPDRDCAGYAVSLGESRVITVHVGSNDARSLSVWSLESGELLRSKELSLGTRYSAATVTIDGRFVIVTSVLTTTDVLSVADLAPVFESGTTVQLATQNKVARYMLEWGERGARFASIIRKKRMLSFIDFVSERESDVTEVPEGTVLAETITNGEQVVARSQGGSVWLWTGLGGRVLGLPHDDTSRVAFSCDGRWLGLALEEGGLSIYQAKDGGLVAEIIGVGATAAFGYVNHDRQLLVWLQNGTVLRYEDQFQVLGRRVWRVQGHAE
jgi:hypothetical protein